MRADMAKVIVERPRLGGSAKRKGRAQNWDQMVSKEGMRAPHVRHWGGKQLNENLAPLRRFLRSRVGQKWNDVYSEISAHLKVTSTIQQHVRDHLDHMVHVNLMRDDDGVLWVLDGYKPYKLGEGYRREELYVDPDDGVLKHVPRKARVSYKVEQEARKAETQRVVDGHELRKHKGIWYEVEIKPVPAPEVKSYMGTNGETRTYEVGGAAYDVILECTVYGRRMGFAVYATTYCATKRQLNHKELKQYGVQND